MTSFIIRDFVGVIYETNFQQFLKYKIFFLKNLQKTSFYFEIFTINKTGLLSTNLVPVK